MRAHQQGFYDRDGRVRDRESRLRQADKLNLILDLALGADASKARCLDIGCASGAITNALAPRFAEMVGLEFDAAALRDAHTSGSAQFVRGDAMRLPFPDGTFQVVLCTQVYEHVPDDRILAAEMHRVLARSGIVIFSGPNWLFPIELHYFLPGLQWLPQEVANAYLRITGKGDRYYERSRTWWGLRVLFSGFVVRDVTLEVLDFRRRAAKGLYERMTKLVPRVLLRLCLPLFPNFNWILIKPNDESGE